MAEANAQHRPEDEITAAEPRRAMQRGVATGAQG